MRRAIRTFKATHKNHTIGQSSSREGARKGRPPVERRHAKRTIAANIAGAQSLRGNVRRKHQASLGIQSKIYLRIHKVRMPQVRNASGPICPASAASGIWTVRPHAQPAYPGIDGDSGRNNVSGFARQISDATLAVPVPMQPPVTSRFYQTIPHQDFRKIQPARPLPAWRQILRPIAIGLQLVPYKRRHPVSAPLPRSL